MKLFYTDLETTGLDPETKTITEIATIYRNLKTRETSTFHAYILPNKKPDDWDMLEKLTGITWKFLEENGKPEYEVYTDYCKWIKKFISPYDKNDKGFFCAYNAKFDQDFIYHFFKHNSGIAEAENKKGYRKGNFFYHTSYDILNTVVLAEIMGVIPIQSGRKLSDICFYLGIPLKAHSGIDDIIASIEVNKQLLAKIKNKLAP